MLIDIIAKVYFYTFAILKPDWPGKSETKIEEGDKKRVSCRTAERPSFIKGLTYDSLVWQVWTQVKNARLDTNFPWWQIAQGRVPSKRTTGLILI